LLADEDTETSRSFHDGYWPSRRGMTNASYIVMGPMIAVWG
jgi:hypothetical protein